MLEALEEVPVGVEGGRDQSPSGVIGFMDPTGVTYGRPRANLTRNPVDPQAACLRT